MAAAVEFSRRHLLLGAMGCAVLSSVPAAFSALPAVRSLAPGAAHAIDDQGRWSVDAWFYLCSDSGQFHHLLRQ